VTFGWDEHDPAVRQGLDQQLRDVVLDQVIASAQAREPFSGAMVRAWHALMLKPITVTPSQAAGGFRHPNWCPSNVAVGGVPGVPNSQVADAVEQVEVDVAPRLAELDDRIPAGEAPATAELVEDVLRCAAELHGAWVQIHPFVNGNGRTSRLLLNWVLLRYGIRPLVRPTPRPRWGPHRYDPSMDRYDFASAASMSMGNHELMLAELRARYRRGQGV
jgi:hypothetical protein